MTETAMVRSEKQTAVANLNPIDWSIPLQVDLDGTLLLSDTLQSRSWPHSSVHSGLAWSALKGAFCHP